MRRSAEDASGAHRTFFTRSLRLKRSSKAPFLKTCEDDRLIIELELVLRIIPPPSSDAKDPGFSSATGTTKENKLSEATFMSKGQVCMARAAVG